MLQILCLQWFTSNLRVTSPTSMVCERTNELASRNILKETIHRVERERIKVQ